ncbi:glycosyltransferase [Pseudodesulfovibrio karagichevae]|uniref:Glycosyltransferase n=1 Tax=Pseudodesulfovibrio karagichevae TaxID=3239305 RepID=A0ABV4K4C5_9BACT
MPRKRKKIVILVDYLGHGGVDRSIHYICDALGKDYPVEILTISDSICPYPLNARIVSLGLPPGPYASFSKEMLVLALATLKLFSYKFRNRGSLFLSFKDIMHIANRVSLFGKKVISVRENKSKGLRFSGAKRKLAEWVLSRVYRSAAAIVVNSWFTGQDLQDNFGADPQRIHVINNPCNTEKIQDLIAKGCEWPFPAGARVLISVGRCGYEKGQWALVRVFADLRKRHDDLYLAIVGEGEFARPLRSLCDKLGVSGHVRFFGFTNNPFVLVARSEVFVMTSLWEGFPNVVLEAMASRTPVVSSYNEGVHEILLGAEAPWETDRDLVVSELGVVTRQLDALTIWDDRPLTDSEKALRDGVELVLNDRDRGKAMARAAFEDVGRRTVGRTGEEWLRVLSPLLR